MIEIVPLTVPEIHIMGIDGLRAFLNTLHNCWAQGYEVRIEGQAVIFKPSPDNQPLGIVCEIKKMEEVAVRTYKDLVILEQGRFWSCWWRKRVAAVTKVYKTRYLRSS